VVSGTPNTHEQQHEEKIQHEGEPLHDVNLRRIDFLTWLSYAVNSSSRGDE